MQQSASGDGADLLRWAAIVGPVLGTLLGLSVSRFFESRDRRSERRVREEEHLRELERLGSAERNRRATDRLDLLFERLEPTVSTIEEMQAKAHHLAPVVARACNCLIYRWPGSDPSSARGDQATEESVAYVRKYKGDAAAEKMRGWLEAQSTEPAIEDQLVACGGRKGDYAVSVPESLPEHLAPVVELYMHDNLGDLDPETLIGQIREGRFSLGPVMTRCRIFGLDALHDALDSVENAAFSLTMAAGSALNENLENDLATIDSYYLGAYVRLREASARVAEEARQLLGFDSP